MNPLNAVFSARKNWVVPYVVFALLFVVLPLLLIVAYAFTDDAGHLTLANFGKFFDHPEAVNTFIYSIGIAIITTLGCQGYEYADETGDQVERFGGFFRAFDLAFENHDVDFAVLVCRSDLTGEEGLDFKLRVGGNFHGVDLERKFVRRKCFQGILNHVDTS